MKFHHVLYSIGLFAFLIFGTFACTDNQRAKNFGGRTIIVLPPGKKLVTATWKDTHLWYLTRNIHPGETIERYELKEQSSWGVLEGTVIFDEQKDLTK